jgi:hypothetical protein
LCTVPPGCVGFLGRALWLFFEWPWRWPLPPVWPVGFEPELLDPLPPVEDLLFWEL